MEWSERGSGVKSTVSDRVITIKWSNDSAEKGIETSFPIERSYSLDRGGGDIIRIPDGGEKKRKKLFLLPTRPKIRDVDSSIRAGFCRRIGTNRIAIKCLTFDEINMVFIPFSFWNWKEVGGGVFKFVRHVLT